MCLNEVYEAINLIESNLCVWLAQIAVELLHGVMMDLFRFIVAAITLILFLTRPCRYKYISNMEASLIWAYNI
jgi:hypothetical protein